MDSYNKIISDCLAKQDRGTLAVMLFSLAYIGLDSQAKISLFKTINKYYGG